MTFKIICKIKDLRHKKDLTQEELADKLGISRQSLINLEQGKWLPSLDLALNVADFFNQTVEEVFTNLENFEKLINQPRQYNVGVPTEGRRKDNMSRDLSPLRPFGLSRFFDDDLFDDDFERLPARIQLNMPIPAINVYEKDNNVVLEAQLPGIKVEDVKIEVADDHVALSGERKEEKEDKEKNFYRKEVSYGSFSRVIPLPVKINPDKAEATSDNGMMKLVLPKLEEKKRKQIEIKVKKTS